MNKKDCTNIAYILAQMLHDGAPSELVYDYLLPQFEELDGRIKQEFLDFNEVFEDEERNRR
jgi:hypothetical protein